MAQVAVTVEGKTINLVGSAANAVLLILDMTRLLESKRASGIIELHIGGTNDDVKAKFNLSPTEK